MPDSAPGLTTKFDPRNTLSALTEVGALGGVDAAGTAEAFVLHVVVPTCGDNELFQPATRT